MNKELSFSINIKNTSLLFFSLFLYSLFSIHYSAPKVHAASSPKVTQVIRVSPVIIHLDLTPATTISYEVTVENLLSTPLPLKAVYRDFDTTAEDGGYVITDHNKSSLLSWLSLDNKEWIIPAKTKQKIALTIKTPQKISLGGYYGLLFFQPVVPQVDKQTIVAAQVGVLLLGDIGVGTTHTNPGEIVSFSLPFVSQETTMPLLLRVKNTSLNFFTAKPIIKIKPLLGEVRTQVLEEKVIFPGKIRRWEQMIRLENIGLGIYTITMQVSSGKGTIREITQPLIIFPWVPALWLSALIVIFVWIFKKKNKLKKAIKAFFHTDELE